MYVSKRIHRSNGMQAVAAKYFCGQHYIFIKPV